MRLIVDLSTDSVIQVEKDPSPGDAFNANGRYTVDVPFPGGVDISPASYMVPVDGGSIIDDVSAGLLSLYPQFDYVHLAHLVQGQEMDLFDLSAQLDNTTNQVMPPPYTGTFSVRAQTGRSAVPSGTVPGGVAILAPNVSTTPPRPGLLITEDLDVSAATGSAITHAQDFLVYWKIHSADTSHDIVSDIGAHAGSNSPAIRTQTELDQELDGFRVAISFDQGVSYTPVERLAHVVAPSPTAHVRLAFSNITPGKVYLASYAILYA